MPVIEPDVAPRLTARPDRRLATRFGLAFFISQLGWAIPGSASGILLQQLSADVAGDEKVLVYATAGTIGAIVSSLAAVLWGLLSDRLHLRYGTRVPLIIGGSILAGLSIAGTAFVDSPTGIILAVALYQLGLGAMTGSFSAVMADYVDSALLGRVSAAAGMGVLLGQMIGGVVGGALVENVQLGFLIVSWTLPAGALIAVSLLRRLRNQVPASVISDELQLAAASDAPASDGRNRKWLVGDASFWWIFAGRALFFLALYMATQYMLFIATDYLGLATADAGRVVGGVSIVFALSAAVFIVIAGPLSDRFKRRKPFVGGASVVLAIAVVPMLLAPSVQNLVLFMVLAGAGFGAYIAVDQALMIDALPSAGSKARDLGILGIATTLPGVFAPAAAGIVVTLIGYSGLFAAVGAIALIAGACMLGVRRLR